MYRIFGSRRRSPTVPLLVGGISLLLFAASFVVDVRIIFERPNYGDVTAIVELIWRAVLGVATLGSFLLEIYNFRSKAESADDSITGLEIGGMNHDIDFHVHVSGAPDSGGPGSGDTAGDGSPSSDESGSDPAESQAGDPENEPPAEN